jgi:hypothetical protein
VRDEVAHVHFAGGRSCIGGLRTYAGDREQPCGDADCGELRTADLERYEAAPETFLLPMIAGEQ